MKATSLIATLFAALFGWLVGIVLGVLGWREYERVRQDQAFNNALAEQTMQGPVIQPGPGIGGHQPEIVECDLCGEDNELNIGDPMLCSNCGQELHLN